jgi:hypothetical protein
MIFLFILIGVIGRLIIHIPDVTPLTSLALFAPTVFSKRTSFLMMLITLLLSDVCLHFFLGYSIFGSWTFFTYSGWLGTIFFGFLFSQKPVFSRAFTLTFFATLCFWIWTNFGTWITTNLYSHDFSGLLQCYIVAIPFLKCGLLGSWAWTIVLFYSCFAIFRKYKAKWVALSL